MITDNWFQSKRRGLKRLNLSPISIRKRCGQKSWLMRLRFIRKYRKVTRRLTYTGVLEPPIRNILWVHRRMIAGVSMRQYTSALLSRDAFGTAAALPATAQRQSAISGLTRKFFPNRAYISHDICPVDTRHIRKQWHRSNAWRNLIESTTTRVYIWQILLKVQVRVRCTNR